MTAAAFRRAAVAATLVLAAALGACTALRLTYSQGPTLSYWWLDGYADFTAQQAPQVRAALAQWFEWHRRSQLPEYTALLERAQREVLADATPAQVCGWWAALLQRRDTALAQLAPAVAEIAPQLTPVQLAHVQRKFDRSNDKWRDEHLQPDARRREHAAVERAVEQAEKLYGRLSREQHEFLAAQVRQAPARPEHTLVLRLRRQQDALEMLRALHQPGLPAAQVQAVVKGWLDRVDEPPDAAARHERDAQQAHWCAASAALHNRTDADQRAHAMRALRGWHDDLASFTTPLAAR